MKYRKEGFSVIEIIAGAIIPVILGVVGMASVSMDNSPQRDNERKAMIVSISDGLLLYSTKAPLPLPDNYIEISTNGKLIAYQGYAGANVLETINFSKSGKDSLDDSFFSYLVSADRKYFQLMGFLENPDGYSSDTKRDRYPYVYGKKLGMLTDMNDVPVQSLMSALDVGTTKDNYKAYLSDSNVIEGDSSVLVYLNPISSCERIKELKWSSRAGTYTLNPSGRKGDEMRKYCDMK